ncbi:MAG: ATP-binding protein [Spirochaetota bacterium]
MDELRARAEDLLEQRGPSADDPLDDEIKELLHELDVHRIELETQNAELIEAQEELLKSKHHLTEAKDKYRDLFELAPVGYFTLDRNGSITEVNFTGARMLGKTKNRVLNKPFVVNVEPGARSEFYRHMKEVLASDVRRTCELELTTASGESFTARLDSIRSTSSAGGGDSFRTAVTDITEQKRLQNELEGARFLAEKANRLKTVFLSTMSHEIRTPLNAIIGLLDLIIYGENTEEEKGEYLGHARESSIFLLQLINDILDFSKLEAGQLDINERPFDAVSVLDKVAARARMLVRNKANPVEVRKKIEPDINLNIVGDPFRVEQVLTNLVSNAAKFTGSGYIEIGARLIDEDVPMLELSVEDTGRGIPDDKRGTIFKPFEQAEERDSIEHGGTGLGLAISVRLVKAMGGELGFESEEGTGSRFFFTLPHRIARARTAPSVPSAEARRGAGGARNKGAEGPHTTGCVLIAEDERLNRMVAERMLRKSGHEVVAVENGIEAIDTFRKRNDIVLVLLDRKMPEMDGPETARRIRSIEREKGLPRTPMIAFTASVTSVERDEMLSAGCDDFVAKPLEWEELNRILDRELG